MYVRPPSHRRKGGGYVIVFALPPSAKTSTPGPTAGTKRPHAESEKARESAGKIFQVYTVCIRRLFNECIVKSLSLTVAFGLGHGFGHKICYPIKIFLYKFS